MYPAHDDNDGEDPADYRRPECAVDAQGAHTSSQRTVTQCIVVPGGKLSAVT